MAGKRMSIANLLLNNHIRLINVLQNVYQLDENAWILDNWEFTIFCHCLALTGHRIEVFGCASGGPESGCFWL
jgi:hypothetical protein